MKLIKKAEYTFFYYVLLLAQMCGYGFVCKRICANLTAFKL